ncbi:O-methyltransferase [Immundisolibacter sp.]|jgi:predicted O-methyltransferase YrrM|uniref:O-methyltransferase n=1 Tax=Immundisolibacter sp. TaxID=1934948 RepID=UPI002B0EF837|nr:class I SAM-dependent methyltransferase [Immundisolibacter sp.]MEA3221294.1 tRNA 5-hydroxyuridine methyltransferase [Immundisolibacter sp.]
MIPDLEGHFRRQTRPQRAELTQVAIAAAADGIPTIGPVLGNLLALLAQFGGARRVLDLGAGNGYSTLYLADGMAGEGEIVALESDPRRAVAARQNLVGCRVRTSVLIGAAQEVLPGLVAPFDLILLDIDKADYLYALDHCARLLRPGGLLVADNTGFVDAEPFNAALAADQRFRSVNLLCLLPGHSPEQDGVALAVRL